LRLLLLLQQQQLLLLLLPLQLLGTHELLSLPDGSVELAHLLFSLLNSGITLAPLVPDCASDGKCIQGHVAEE
jgi:hypothetical protein